MDLKNFILVLFFNFSIAVANPVKIAFMEMPTKDGKLIQLEPGGRFVHVALSYQGQWLHSHPFFGVEVISEEKLQQMGQISEVLVLPSILEPNEEFVQTVKGQKFDAEYSWDNHKMYCSELVGKFLNIDPEPMNFLSAFWPEHYKRYQGQLGLSPDDIHKALILRQAKKENWIPACQKVFK